MDHPKIEPTDTFPLWSFGYLQKPSMDSPDLIMTSRGRTPEEAFFLIRLTNAFREPDKTGRLESVLLASKEEYDKGHPYNWFNDAPFWLKQATKQFDLIW